MQPAIYSGGNPFQPVIQNDGDGKQDAAGKDAPQRCNKQGY